MDRFREFVKSEGFGYTYDIDDELMQQLLTDDLELMKFGDRMIRQIMYAEETIPMKKDAMETHLANRGKNKIEKEHDVMDRPSMASYEMPLDGEAENDAKKGDDQDK